jgi:CheY-like chemotaxis protein
MPHNRTVLIVEDEALVALSLESQLNEMGLNTIVASGLESAIAAANELSIDLAVLDYYLNGAKTDAVAACLRKRRIPFVVCSGAQFEDMSEVFVGAELLPKPYTDELLEGAIHNTLRLRA